MNLDDFSITCFCWIDDRMTMLTRSQRLRQRGPMPKLSDSEVLTMEVVGSYLGISQDEALVVFFQEHYTHFSRFDASASHDLCSASGQCVGHQRAFVDDLARWPDPARCVGWYHR